MPDEDAYDLTVCSPIHALHPVACMVHKLLPVRSTTSTSTEHEVLAAPCRSLIHLIDMYALGPCIQYNIPFTQPPGRYRCAREVHTMRDMRSLVRPFVRNTWLALLHPTLMPAFIRTAAGLIHLCALVSLFFNQGEGRALAWGWLQARALWCAFLLHRRHCQFYTPEDGAHPFPRGFRWDCLTLLWLLLALGVCLSWVGHVLLYLACAHRSRSLALGSPLSLILNGPVFGLG